MGAQNFFLFGLTAAEVQALKASGYQPRAYYEKNKELHDVMDLLNSGFFTRGDAGVLRPLLDNLMNYDPYLVLADFQSYMECQDLVSATYGDPEKWTRMSILNTARSGKFSSDRAIREYCKDIWQVGPVPIQLNSKAAVQAQISP